MDRKVTLSYSEDGKELASMTFDIDFLGSIFEAFDMENITTVLKKADSFVKEQQQKAHEEYVKLAEAGLERVVLPEKE